MKKLCDDKIIDDTKDCTYVPKSGCMCTHPKGHEVLCFNRKRGIIPRSLLRFHILSLCFDTSQLAAG